MKHIVETTLQINGQNNRPKTSETLTYFHNFTLRFFFLKKSQKFKISVDIVTKKS